MTRIEIGDGGIEVEADESLAAVQAVVLELWTRTGLGLGARSPEDSASLGFHTELAPERAPREASTVLPPTGLPDEGDGWRR